jgi:hypothetical protein
MTEHSRADRTQQVRQPVAGFDAAHRYRTDRAMHSSRRRSGSVKPMRQRPVSGFMTTLLNKTVKREVRIRDQAYIVAISPLALKLTPKGKRKGLELHWDALVSGDAALAAALNASVVKLPADPARRA